MGPIEEFDGWLTRYSAADADPGALLTRFINGLRERGIAIFRASLWLPTAHPELWGTQVIWNEAGGAEVFRRDHAVTATPTYRNTPGEAVHEARRPLRWRLGDPAAKLPYPLLDEIRAGGGTDYLIVPFHTDHRQEQPWVTFSTRAANGFTDGQIAAIESACVPMGWKTRVAMSEGATRSLLRVYLGPNAAEQVLAGQFRRGRSTSLDAVIWFCDLRGFTLLGDSLPAARLVGLLDRYFECVAGPIEEHGGEVLKFIGDAVLAVFPLSEPGAARSALAAARKVLAALVEQSAELRTQGLPALEMGIALHVGEVLYGNVGGRSRLDFTVIGPAVNEASRVEGLCKSLEEPLLMTADFVKRLDDRNDIRSLGDHRLRSVSRSQELFTLKSADRSGRAPEARP